MSRTRDCSLRGDVCGYDSDGTFVGGNPTGVTEIWSLDISPSTFELREGLTRLVARRDRSSVTRKDGDDPFPGSGLSRSHKRLDSG